MKTKDAVAQRVRMALDHLRRELSSVGVTDGCAVLYLIENTTGERLRDVLRDDADPMEAAADAYLGSPLAEDGTMVHEMDYKGIVIRWPLKD